MAHWDMGMGTSITSGIASFKLPFSSICSILFGGSPPYTVLMKTRLRCERRERVF